MTDSSNGFHDTAPVSAKWTLIVLYDAVLAAV